MWDGLLMLLFWSVVMGVASFLAGSLPLSFSLSSRHLRLMTALGTGVLVGTSLIVIIPEGVETLYSSANAPHSHNERALRAQARDGIVKPVLVPTWLAHDSVRRNADVEFVQLVGLDTIRRGADEAPEEQRDDAKPLDSPSRVEDEPVHDSDGSQTDPSDQERKVEPHAWIGVALILGFILMYLIDTLPQTVTSTSQPQRFPISLNQFSFNRASSTARESVEIPSGDAFAAGNTLSHTSTSRPSSTTVGLVIHAAADGIALGASSTTSSPQLSFIIFIALMIHKAPAAFGLTSVLLKQGLSKRMARTHLIVFSLAAPIGALLTWAAVHLLGLSTDSLGESASTEFATGVLLLFSGGTFLYVAMHTMQESGSGLHSHQEDQLNGYAAAPLDNPYGAHVPSPQKPHSTTLVDTTVTVIGMLFPLLTQLGHVH